MSSEKLPVILINGHWWSLACPSWQPW